MFLAAFLSGLAFMLRVLAVAALSIFILAKASDTYDVPTLTFHMVAINGGATVLGGSLEGPEDSPVAGIELILQFYMAGALVETRTVQLNSLRWPKASFKVPLVIGADCYEVVALRAFDSKNNFLPSADATSEVLKPGRCLASSH